MPKIQYEYSQHTVSKCSGVLDVPDEVVAAGDSAVHEYVREHECDATHAYYEVEDWHDEVAGTFEYEALP